MTLRRATAQDADRLLAWRNDPDVRGQSLATRPVDAEEHRAWLARVLADPRRHLFIVLADGQEIGTARVDVALWMRAGAETFETVPIGMVSITLDDAWRGQGYGQAIIQQIVGRAAEFGTEEFVVHVRTGNTASLIMFLKQGFVLQAVDPVRKVAMLTRRAA